MAAPVVVGYGGNLLPIHNHDAIPPLATHPSLPLPYIQFDILRL